MSWGEGDSAGGQKAAEKGTIEFPCKITFSPISLLYCIDTPACLNKTLVRLPRA
jgi:hypothetical protein